VERRLRCKGRKRTISIDISYIRAIRELGLPEAL